MRRCDTNRRPCSNRSRGLAARPPSTPDAHRSFPQKRRSLDRKCPTCPRGRCCWGYASPSSRWCRRCRMLLHHPVDGVVGVGCFIGFLALLRRIVRTHFFPHAFRHVASTNVLIRENESFLLEQIRRSE